MPYVDGLPIAATVSATDILPIVQGGTEGQPGTAVTAQISVQDLFNGLISGGVLLADLPTSDVGLETGRMWNNGGVLCIA